MLRVLYKDIIKYYSFVICPKQNCSTLRFLRRKNGNLRLPQTQKIHNCGIHSSLFITLPIHLTGSIRITLTSRFTNCSQILLALEWHWWSYTKAVCCWWSWSHSEGHQSGLLATTFTSSCPWIDKALDPFKASSSRKSPSPRHPSAVVTVPAFLPDAVFTTSEPGMTLFSASGIAEMERLRVHHYKILNRSILNSHC